jgi:MYXO-CTERM domain-containing protein
MTTSDAVTFPLLDKSATLARGKTFVASVAFVPRAEGAVSGQIVVASNDPKAPTQIITLKGLATAMPATTTQPPPNPPLPLDVPNDCGCRVVGAPTEGAPWAAAGLVVGSLLRLRRRRRAVGGVTRRRDAPAR